MSEADEILQSYLRLVARLSGAASVSLYVPPAVGAGREMLIHHGLLDPLPELADADAAAEFHRRFGAEPSADDGKGHLASGGLEGILYRIPLRWVRSGPDIETSGPERRKREGRTPELAVWIGLRFERDTDGGRRDLLWFATAAGALRDEGWWKGFLGLAAAFADHTRTLSRAVFDQVTELPDRTHFQGELETALIHAQETKLPFVLLLLGPDDFSWVNDRLDRPSGDQVLREVATLLRGGLRSHDHVARYGGATFTAILLGTPLEDGRVVAENVVRRLSDHRYQEGILRLEFSAGVAVADPNESVDAQELIRRADQALSAAKRGSAGSVRAWERGSDVEQARSVDRLQGIFTGDKSKDYRNMRLLLDSVAVVAASTDARELALSFSERLFETLHARRVGVLERSPTGAFELLGGLERGEEAARPFSPTERDLAVVERACRDGNFVAEGGSEPGDLSLCALPLFLQGRCLGGIVLEVASISVSFEGSDRRFLDAL
ncbi:MAG TPA: diguanylate cyclase, partial [Vicinamibacteria bacterium]|nr:diguanylate cyclase [Vicinamibacteria bacterium]